MKPRIKPLGFTLVELLIVIVILGIIALLALPVYEGFILKAKIAEANHFIGAIKTGEEAYYAETNEYVDDISYLDIDMPSKPARNWLYSVETSTAIDDPPGFAYNAYCIVAHPNINKAGMGNVTVHSHIHSDGAIAEWKSDTAVHSHGAYSHAHAVSHGNPY